MAKYDWKPFYRELAEKLLLLEQQNNNNGGNNRQWLIDILQKLVVGTNVKLPHNNNNITISNCDPLSIFIWLQVLEPQDRKIILNNAKKALNLNSNTPTDYSGTPSSFKANAYPIDLSDTNQVTLMWELFKSTLNYPDNNFEQNLDDVIKKDGGNKIIQVSSPLFMIRPDIFLPLAGNVLDYLNTFPQPSKFIKPENAKEYIKLISYVQNNINNGVYGNVKSFEELSDLAYIAKNANNNRNSNNNNNNNTSGSISSNKIDYKKFLSDNKNIILYGPPGTGKTYNTVHLAMAMIKDEYNIDEDFNIKDSNGNIVDHKKLLGEFNSELKNENGHIQFTTFHQSYGYEEFIEGIKPDLEDDSENISYSIESGVFKEFCERTESNSSFELDYNYLKDAVLNGTYDSQNGMLEISCANKSKIIIAVNSKSNFTFWTEAEYKRNQEKNANRDSGTLTKEKLKLVYEGKVMDYHQAYYNAVVNYMRNKGKNTNITTKEENKNDNFVFIIDEINRGNISKIFGELITLIEKTKRKGESEEMWATLPYSKDEFAVPNNVYIIGTMNTADRSIALIDTALRRRFKFIEMMPKEKLINNNKVMSSDKKSIDVSEIIKKMNKRIEYLFDREHTIGHSYFMNINNINDLDNVMRNDIIPLLQEYFYEDYKKIRMILGDNRKKDNKFAFIVEDDADRDKIFGNEDADLIDEEKMLYKINESEYTNWDFYEYLQ